MEEDHPGKPVQRRGHRRRNLLTIAGVFLLIGGGVILGVYLRANQNRSLLPARVVQQARDFTPYFYLNSIPAGYALDTTHISTDAGILIVPLTSQGRPTIVLTEQRLPDNAAHLGIQDNGQKVTGTNAPATINDVEGRLVGTMVVDSQKTLIFLNAPGNADKGDITALLRGLQPIQH